MLHLMCMRSIEIERWFIMWTNILASVIQKIGLSLETSVTNIETVTTEIAAMDTSHLKYGTQVPVFPKLEFIAQTELTIGTAPISCGISFAADDEIVLGADGYYAIAGLDLVFNTPASCTYTPTNVEKISGTYYEITSGTSFYSYNSSFSSRSAISFAETAGDKAYKRTFESSKLVAYVDYEKKVFLTDGSLDATSTTIPQDREYQRGIDIGLECMANRFIKTARYDGEVYILNPYLIPFDAKFRPIGTYIYFTYAYPKAYSNKVIAGLGRWELI